MTDSTQTLSEDLIQMVDENGKFMYGCLISFSLSSPLEDFNDKVQKWGFLDKGFDYYCVAVLGAQSSGKSELSKFRTDNIESNEYLINYCRYFIELAV